MTTARAESYERLRQYCQANKCSPEQYASAEREIECLYQKNMAYIKAHEDAEQAEHKAEFWGSVSQAIDRDRQQHQYNRLQNSLDRIEYNQQVNQYNQNTTINGGHPTVMPAGR